MDNDYFYALFSDLDGCRLKRLKKGEVLFQQGDSADYVFSVKQGELRAMRYSRDGSAICLHTAGEGESFASAALFTPSYHCNGEAALKTEVWCYPREGVLARLDSDPDCRNRVFSQLAGEVRYLRSLLELRGTVSATERVHQYLKLQADGKGLIRFQRPLVNYARELGMAHETFYRALADLEKDGVIERIDKRQFRVLSDL